MDDHETEVMKLSSRNLPPPSAAWTRERLAKLHHLFYAAVFAIHGAFPIPTLGPV